MSQKSVVIIGAGIAGLSAGCYAQMNGFRALILESHDKAGGLCTSWRRSGYTVDGCLHWLMGCRPGTPLYGLWQELGVYPGKQILTYDEFTRFEGEDGKRFVLYTDLDRLEQHMMELAPEDRGLVREFIGAVRTCTRYDLPIQKAPELFTLFDTLKLMTAYFPFIRILRKWNSVSIADFASRFRNPFLREGLTSFFIPAFSMSFMILTLSYLHRKDAGYPLGGSLSFARDIERNFLRLGGSLQYRSRVAEIMVEKNSAVGVRLEDGSEHRANYVISAADGYATIFKMLKGAYLNRAIRRYYERFPIFPPFIQVALGVNMAFTGEAPSAVGINFPLQGPLSFPGSFRDMAHVRICAHIYNFDPTLVPLGKTVVKVMFPADYDFWHSLRSDPARYRAEKDRIANAVIVALDRRFPGLAKSVEMRDVATPDTYYRYTGNWQGSIEGWIITPRTWMFTRSMKKTLPGLKNFYMAGQWVEPGGGVPPAALSGRNAVQLLCRKEKKEFTAVS